MSTALIVLPLNGGWMSGGPPKKIGRSYERNLDAGQFQPMIDSWELGLEG